MTTYFFPDNTVLVNFTHIGRQDVLEWFLRGNGAWTLSIRRECARSSHVPGLEGMAYWDGILPSPLIPRPVEVIDARTIATQMLKPGDTDPAKNMGEAETIAVITRRLLRSVFLTDDYDAARRASAEELIDVVSTTKILAMADVMGQLSHDDAVGALDRLRTLGRVLGPPGFEGYDAYVARLATARRTSREQGGA